MTRDLSLEWHPQPVSRLDLRGRSAIVVGGTGGIGRALARLLASRGAAVTVVGRTCRDAGRPGISFVAADLSTMAEALRVASELPAESVDLLVFTAGIIAAPRRQVNRDGIELDMAVSYLNRFVMLREMAPRLLLPREQGRSAPRVFIMGFPGVGHAGDPEDLNAERAYRAWPAHLNTVAANEALTRDAAQRYPGLAVFGLNPGIIKSDIRANIWGPDSLRGRVIEKVLGWFTPSTDAYARRLLPLLVAPEIECRSGALFDRKGRAILPSPNLTSYRVGRFMQASAALASKAGEPAGIPDSAKPSLRAPFYPNRSHI